MYTLVLLLCIFAVVISPVFIDMFLNMQEAREELRARRLFGITQKKDPHLVWASPRLR